MKILLAVDGSQYTQRMLAYLAAHPELLGPTGEFTALTVVTAVPPHVTGYIDRASLQKYYDDQAEEVLKTVRGFAAERQWKPTFVTKVGNAADTIAATAKEGQYDLVMMGSHGHSPLSSLVMGSVTSRVLGHCATPVLIVR
ncbi:universal stress protein [Piscinibacter sp. HJYY11]|uniref:universal stress protein n=1 Tax=Piscinibacter sp. HJYY11 TaxID=2801333 RepID=UPI00191EBC58|nr:universal stress protein [Piscinibacter sp. HJYY11]MBL0726453.1 universal stress protein [Piscinibacter sp. HJYY11]